MGWGTLIQYPSMCPVSHAAMLGTLGRPFDSKLTLSGTSLQVGTVRVRSNLTYYSAILLHCVGAPYGVQLRDCF